MTDGPQCFAHEPQYSYGKKAQFRLPSTAERTIPVLAFYYAKHVIGGRWPEGEPVILRGYPELAIEYAYQVTKQRWIEAENRPFDDAEPVYRYTVDILKRPWPEVENLFLPDPLYASLYARKVLKRPWPEAEARIAMSTYRLAYMSAFPEVVHDWVHNGWIDWMETDYEHEL